MAPPEKKRLRQATAAAIIPDDLLIDEILVRLPAKSLALCRCVCRSWRAGIAGDSFVGRHLELSRKRPPSLLAIPREVVDISNDRATTQEISFHRFLLPPAGRAPPQGVTDADLVFEKAWPEGITWLISPAHCDGLVVISTSTGRVFVCNLATREFVALPPGNQKAELDHNDLLAPPVAIGFDQWRNAYVVARYFYRTYGEYSQSSHDHDVGHEVFTLGSDSSRWELTQDPSHAVGVAQRPICTRQAFYWHSDMPKPRLMRFSLRDRTFDVVSRPPAGWNALDDMTELDGKLCYVHATAGASFHVWLADEMPELRWSLRYRIHLLHPVPGINYDLKPVSIDGDALVAIAGDTLCRYYSVQQGQGTEEVLDMRASLRYQRPDGSKYMCPPGLDYVLCLLPYTESLVPLRACTYSSY